MIGFFEHQYLSYKKNHIKNLLALARADGDLHPREEELLFKIGRRYGLKDRQVEAIVASNEPHILNIPDNHNDKMNLIYDLLLMIHADEKVATHEVAFLEDVVVKLGLKKEIVAWLLNLIEEKGIPPRSEEWDAIKAEAIDRWSYQV